MLKVIVIGGVAAGMSAASKLKRNLRDKVEITVYEQGGSVSYGACGIPFYVSGIVEKPEDLVARSAEKFRESGINVELYHEVISTDTTGKTVLVRNVKTGEEFIRGYDKLIIGSGARSNRFPPLDVKKSNIISVSDLTDAYNLRVALENPQTKNTVIVGAGYVGLEIADACKGYNKNITIIEKAPRVLSTMDKEFSEILEKELEKNNVVLKTNSSVVALESNEDIASAVVVDKEGQRETIPADLIICCLGVTPQTEFITGVAKHSNGAIKVDQNMRSSIPDVFAAGDCSIMKSFITGQRQYMPLGTNANKQGRIIADVIAGKPAPTFKLIGSTALKLFGCDVAKVGISEQDAEAVGIPYKTTIITGNSFASYYSGEKVTIKLVYDPPSNKILGAQLAGQGTVVPRANYFAIAIANGMPADEFGFMDLCYSPPFSGVWDASLIAANTCK